MEGGAEGRGSSATSVGGGGRRKSGPVPTTTDSETSPPLSPRKQPPALPRTLAALTVSRSSPVAPASPRPAPLSVPAGRRVREALGRELLSGPGYFRGARGVSPPPQEDDVDAEQQAAEACCCLAHSPPLNSNLTSGCDGVKRLRRWYFRVALRELERGRGRFPHPRGHLEDSGLPRRSAARRIWCFCGRG